MTMKPCVRVHSRSMSCGTRARPRSRSRNRASRSTASAASTDSSSVGLTRLMALTTSCSFGRSPRVHLHRGQSVFYTHVCNVMLALHRQCPEIAHT